MYLMRASTRRSAHEAWRASRVAEETAQELLRRLDVFAVTVGQTSPFRIDAPPALEAPKALVLDAESRDSAARATRLAGLEVEEALEDRRRAGAIRLALAGVEQDHARRTRPDVVGAPRRATATAAPRSAV